MNSNVNVFTGAILGFNRKRNSWSTPQKLIGMVTNVSSSTLSIIYQDKTDKSTLSIYDLEQIVCLPLTEELLDNTEFFMKNGDSWASPNSSVIISKNPDSSNRKWNVKFLDEKRNVISIANFNYINELQSYAALAEVNLDLKLGTIRVLYQNYLDNL